MVCKLLVSVSVLLACVCGSYTASSVYFVDNSEGSYLKHSEGVPTLTSSSLSVATSSLLGVQPVAEISEDASKQVSGVLSPNVFSRPAVVFTVQVTGVDSDVIESQQQTLARGRPVVKAKYVDDTTSEKHTQEGLLAAVGLAGKTVSPVVYKGLEHLSASSGCNEVCVAEQLKAALPAMNANYTEAGLPLRGELTLPAGDGQVTRLDLANVADRLFAVEVASLHSTGVAFAQEQLNSAKVAASAKQLDSTLVSLQGLKLAYGADSPQYKAAVAAAAAVVGEVQSTLAAASGNRAVAQISLLGDIAQKNGLVDLVNWQAASHKRRTLLQIPPPPGIMDYEGTIKFQTRSAAILSFIIVVAFLIAGCHCLTHMNFKADTLLYSRAKME